MEKGLSLVEADKRSGAAFMKKSGTKHRLVSKRAKLPPKWKQELCQWWGASRGPSEAHVVPPVSQRCTKDPGSGNAESFPDPPAQALLTAMKEGSYPASSPRCDDRGVSQGVSSSPAPFALFSVLPVAGETSLKGLQMRSSPHGNGASQTHP